MSSSVSTPTSALSPPSNASTTSTTPWSSNSGIIPQTQTQTRSNKTHLAPQPARVSIKPVPVPSRTALPRVADAAPINKMSMASVISPMPAPSAAKGPMSMTSKEWVIPPRPKPGRKPATDTPPTKRKAQNRAAQRAFRERRAARVGELEEQLDAEKEEHEKTERELHDKIHSLEMDAQALQSRCEVLENMLDKERAERAREVESLTRRLHEATQNQRQRQQQSLPSVSSLPQHTYAPTPLRHHRPSVPSLDHGGRDSRSSLPSVAPTTAQRRSTAHAFSISQIISPPEDIEQAPTDCSSCGPNGPCACAEEAINNMPVGCGKCTLGSSCECLEEVFNGGINSGSKSNYLSGTNTPVQVIEITKAPKRTIRSISPSSVVPDEKRQRANVPSPTEIDFTAMFSRKPQRAATATSQSQSQSQSRPAPTPINTVGTPHSSAPSPYAMASVGPVSVASPHPATEDRCGFCEDGTYCVCAAEAANNLAAGLAPVDSSLTLPAIQTAPISHSRSNEGQQTRMTPPPSEGDAVPFGYEILPDGAVKLPGVRALQSRNRANEKTATTESAPAKSGGCGPGGPGTCTQCLMDPISGLFCRSLAANFKKQNGEGGGGCCGGAVPGGGCCKKQNNAPTGSKPSAALGNKKDMGLSLSCADAYKTLASHRHFDEAADDIGTWLPLLRAAPKPREPALGGGRDTGGSSRTPIEVEAASIMSVLKGFDVRFGRGE